MRWLRYAAAAQRVHIFLDDHERASRIGALHATRCLHAHLVATISADTVTGTAPSTPPFNRSDSCPSGLHRNSPSTDRTESTVLIVARTLKPSITCSVESITNVEQPRTPLICSGSRGRPSFLKHSVSAPSWPPRGRLIRPSMIMREKAAFPRFPSSISRERREKDRPPIWSAAF